jgi:peptidoglycan hydrolase-like protein with peptidoglycan-binding domain
MKKYLLVGFLVLALLFVSVGSAEASGLTQAQITAVLDLLRAFNADQATINNVQASLNGQATPAPSSGFCYNWNDDLTVGSHGVDVRALDTALLKQNIPGATSVEGKPTFISDDGSFIGGTATAVGKFQKKYTIPQTGYVGPKTRAKLNELYGCQKQSITVLSPKTGDVWVIGRTYDITYAAGQAGSVTISLVKYSDDGVALNSNIIGSSNTGKLSYTVATGTEITRGEAGRYKIEIYPPQSRELVGRSGYFSISN